MTFHDKAFFLPMARLGGFFLYLFWAVIILPTTIVLGLFLLAISFIPGTRPFLSQIARFWGRLAIHLTFTRVKITGGEKLQDEPAIIISNHQSPFDIYTALGFYPQDFLFLSKKEMFRVPIIGTAMKRMNFISVDRSNVAGAVRSLREMVRKVKENNRILIYPEGTRSDDPQNILPFKAGTLVVARQGKIPIVPIVVYGTATVKPLKQKFTLYPGIIGITVLDPIRPDSPLHPASETGETEAEKMEKIRQLVINTYNEMKEKYGK